MAGLSFFPHSLASRLTRLFLLLLLIGGGAACSLLQPKERDLAVVSGRLFLYAEPLPADRDLQRFELTAISAVGDDDSEHPLELRLTDCSRSTLEQQRLLATARLPIGHYRGLIIESKCTIVSGDESETPPPVRHDKTNLTLAFSVTPTQPQLVFLDVATPPGISADGQSPPPSFSFRILVRPLASLAGYVSHQAANTITLFDKKSWQVAKVIPTGNGPVGMVLDAPRKRLYVALSKEDAIDVIDTETLERINQIRLNLGDEPVELALTPDGLTLLCVNRLGNTLSFVDPGALIQLERIPVGHGPTSLLLDPSGHQVYVFNTLADSMTVVDLLNREVIATLPLEAAPLRGAFNRKGDRLFVIHERSPYLLVIDSLRLQIVKRIDVGIGALALKIDPVTDLLYISRQQDQVIRIYDPFSLLPSDFILAGGEVTHLAFDRELNQMLSTLPQRSSLQIHNLLSRKPVAEIELSDPPDWVTFSGER